MKSTNSLIRSRSKSRRTTDRAIGASSFTRSNLNDRSPAALLLTLLCGLMLNLLATATVATAAESDFSQPIDVSADRSEYNQKTGKQVLSGNVEIRQGSMLIKADSIDVVLADNKLSKIEGQGSPITFQQLNEEGELVTGSCDSISYDAVNGVLTMTGNALLKQPKQELKSDSIVFNSINQSVIAQGGKSGRVSITIQPPDRN